MSLVSQYKWEIWPTSTEIKSAKLVTMPSLNAQHIPTTSTGLLMAMAVTTSLSAISGPTSVFPFSSADGGY